jgi:anti-anti-sigma factor
MRKLELQTKVVDKTVQLRLVGDVQADNAQVLRERLQKEIPAGARHIYVDLAGLHRVDTAGVAVLVDLAREIKQRGGGVYLVQVPPAVSSILELLGSAREAFQVFSSLDEALRRTQSTRPRRLHDPTKPMPVK